MDLLNFLASMVASDAVHVAAAAVPVGLIVFFLIRAVDNNFTVPPNVKFLGSIALAYVVPIAISVAYSLLSGAQVDLNSLFLAASIGWIISQGIHRALPKEA